MPLADFAGSRNWGYDGVLWYAPDSAYGRPDDLKALIDAAHLRGLMVFLDVVYNHFGPEGNYLGRYAPDLLHRGADALGQRDRLSRAGGARLRHRERAALAARISLRRAAARCRACHRRSSAKSRCCDELSRAVGDLAAETGRHIHLVLENDDNIAGVLDAEQDPPRGNYRAQWNDDYHHAWHVLLTGETPRLLQRLCRVAAAGHRARAGIRLRLSGRTVARIAMAAIARRAERPPGAPSPSSTFLQNHDQIGNRALGDRLESTAEPEAIEARAGDSAAGADGADAVHGRGMGLEGAIPVLLRFRGRSRRGRAPGPAQGICRRL